MIFHKLQVRCGKDDDEDEDVEVQSLGFETLGSRGDMLVWKPQRTEPPNSMPLLHGVSFAASAGQQDEALNQAWLSRSRIPDSVCHPSKTPDS